MTVQEFAARAKRLYQAAHLRFQSETNSDEAACDFARACFDYADLSTNRAERARLAEQGIATCRKVLKRAPQSVPAHYYLGMNLGQLADTKRNLSALRMVGEMEREFRAALVLDPQYDHAGPDRNLGLLYLQAPVFISVGNRNKARQHLRHAVELAPNYPENRLNLIEAYLKWGDFPDARRQLTALEALWLRARQALSGENWASSWQDWEKRLKRVQARIRHASRTLESPRNNRD